MGDGNNIFTEIKRPSNNDVLLGPLIVIILLLMFVSGVLLYKNRKIGNELSIQNNNIQALNDTLKTTYNKDSSKTYRIQVLEGLNKKQLSDIGSQDSTIMELNYVVKQTKLKLQSATVFNSNTSIDAINVTTVTVTNKIHDTCDYKNVVFSSNIHLGKWVNGNIRTTWDSTQVNIIVHNEYSAVVGFNKKVPYADITTKNPYDTIKVVRTFEITLPPPKHYQIAVFGGYGISSDGNIIHTGFMIGVGISRTLIRLPF